MAYGCGILVVIVIILLGLGKCQQSKDAAELNAMMAQMEREAKNFDSPTLPASSDGTPLPINSDPGVTYHLLSSKKMPYGNLEVVTRRDGSSGTSFARREIDCSKLIFRYLGEGDTLVEARKDSPNIGDMAEAMSTSISGEVARFACSRPVK